MLYQCQHFGVSEYFCREQGENFSFPLHMHHSFELITVTEGEMRVTVEDRVYELTAGEGVLIFPEQLHALSSTKSKHLLVIFSSDLVSAYASRRGGSVPRDHRLRIPAYVQEQLAVLDGTSSVIRIKAALYALCAILDEGTAYVKREGRGDSLLHRIFDFVDRSYGSECGLAALSAALGYHSAYLSRYFKEVTGMAFLTYVNRYRVNKACYLLQSAERSVLECALGCGYRSLRSFNRNFKLATGLTPKEYREAH